MTEDSVTKFKTEILVEARRESIACPFHQYDALRSEHPIAHIRHGDDNIFVLTRFEDVVQVLRQADVFSNRRAGGPRANAIAQVVRQAVAASPELKHLIERLGEPAAPVLDLADPPEHTRQRRLVADTLVPQRIAALEGMLASYVDELIDRFIDRGHFEVVEEFSSHLPLRAITELLGIPEDMRPTFRKWTDDQVSVMGNPTLTVEHGLQVARTNVEFFNYFAREIERRKQTPGDDLISLIVAANERMPEKLDRMELIGIIHQLSGAGHETTRNLITGCVLALAQDPALFERLRNSAESIEPFVEEMLRLESPTTSLFRVATTDTQINGCPIPQGSLIWVFYAAANRDPAMFPHPDSIDLERPNLRKHVAFGFGRHACVGAALARKEVNIAIRGIVRRLRNIRLADDVEISYGRSYILRGIERLPISFARA